MQVEPRESSNSTVDLNSSVSIITLNKNELNAPIKGQKIIEWHRVYVPSAYHGSNPKYKET